MVNDDLGGPCSSDAELAKCDLRAVGAATRILVVELFSSTTLVSATGLFVTMEFQRKILSEYSSSVPIILWDSGSPQHEIVDVGNSRRTIHLPRNVLGIVCATQPVIRNKTPENKPKAIFKRISFIYYLLQSESSTTGAKAHINCDAYGTAEAVPVPFLPLAISLAPLSRNPRACRRPSHTGRGFLR
jgi:hypothetical protein